MTASPFPPDFRFGVSTSAYQIEGAFDADGKGLSIWDLHCRQKDRVANGDTGDVACDHYHRFAEDVGLMTGLGLNAYRYSVSWPRVLPAGRGAANPAGLDFYDRLTDLLLAKGIEPWVCLYHWDLPQGLENLGGWLNRDSAGWFGDYATLMGKRLGDRVRHWVTVNEPAVATIFAYGYGWNAPCISDVSHLMRVIHHVNLAHGAGVDALRAAVPGAKIGCVHNVQQVRPSTDKPEDAEAALALDAIWNLAFPDPQLKGDYPARLWPGIAPYAQPGDLARICRPTDFFGLNHYGPIYAVKEDNLLGFGWGPFPDAVRPADGSWPIFPDDFRDMLVHLTSKYRLPIYVTENGSGGLNKPDDQGRVADPDRVRYLGLYTDAMRAAMASGADVAGYFVWTLLDCFEWNSGYGNPFGLVHVDYASQKRTPKDSYAWYRDFIAKARAGA